MLDFNRFGRRLHVGASLRARPGEVLEMDALRAAVPSIFATEAHESRSARFAPISTAAVLEGLQAEGFEPVAAMQARTRDESKREFTKHMLRLRHRGDVGRTMAVGDSLFEIVLVNANDGSAAYHMAPGVFRLVCLNGMMTGDTYGEVKVRHSGNAVGEVIEGAYRVLGEAPRVADQVGQWTGLQLAAREAEIMAEAAHVLRFGEDVDPEGVPVRPADLLRARRRDDSGADLWRTFNRLQENVIKGGQSGRVLDANGRRRNATTREVKGIDQNRNLNRALWMLAERMAELKAA